MDTLKVRIDIPQKKEEQWKVAVATPGKSVRLSRKKTAVSAYTFVERRIKRFLATPERHKTAVWVQDGQYHNDGEYTDHKTALYALTCFLEENLNKAFLTDRMKKYFTGL